VSFPVEYLISNDIDKQSLLVYGESAVSDFSLLTTEESLLLLNVYPPEIIFKIFPESSLILQGILLNIAVGNFQILGVAVKLAELI